MNKITRAAAAATFLLITGASVAQPTINLYSQRLTAHADSVDDAKKQEQKVQDQVDKIKSSGIDDITNNLNDTIKSIAELQNEAVPVQARYMQLNEQIASIKKTIEEQAPELQQSQIDSSSDQFDGKSESFSVLRTLFTKGIGEATKQAVEHKQLNENVRSIQESLNNKRDQAKTAKDKLDQSIKEQITLLNAASDKLSESYKSLGIDDVSLNDALNNVQSKQNDLIQAQIKGEDTTSQQQAFNDAQNDFMTKLNNALSTAKGNVDSAKAQQLAAAQAALIQSRASASVASATASSTSSAVASTASASAPVASTPSGWHFYNNVAPTNSLIYGNPNYPDGQCTSYAAGRARQFGKTISNTMGNGGEWGSSATSLGMTTSSTPQPGDLVSFAPGVAGAVAGYGHVAFVEDVHSDGSFLVSEANYAGPYVTFRVISGATSGMTFIR